MSSQKQGIGAVNTETITLASLVSTSARVGTQIDLLSSGLLPIALTVEIYLTHGTSPTSGSSVDIYNVWGDGESTAHIDGNLAATDTGYTSGSTPLTAAQIRNSGMEPLAAAVSQGVTNEPFKASFDIPVRGRYYSNYVYNGTGVALNSTSGNFYIRVFPRYGDSQ